MNRRDIMLATSNLADFLEAGMPMAEAVERMKHALPRYSELWEHGAEIIRSGYPLSSVFESVWPESLVAVVKAGEDSGSIARIFRDIESTLLVEAQVIRSSLKVLYPLGMLAAGIVVGLFFMIAVLPGIASSLDSADSAVLDASVALAGFYHTNMAYIYAVAVIAGIGIIYLLRDPKVKGALFSFALSIPRISGSLTDLRFGIWARYASLCLSTGISTKEALRITEPILPLPLQEIVYRIRQDLDNNIPLQDCVDIERLDSADPRRDKLPFFVANALATAAQTGNLHVALSKASPTLIRQGTASLNRVVEVGKVVGIAFAAAAIITPLGVVYSELFQAMQNLK